jgi:hypothetical protein
MINNNEKMIPLFDEVKLQAQILVPIINELRIELGKKKADELIGKAIRPYVRSVYHKIGERKSGEPFEKWEKAWDEIRPRIGNDVEREYIRNDDSSREYNVKRCRFAEFFKEIGEPELGTMLMCDFDYYIAEIGAPIVVLTRTQTIMEGADHCDFCYTFKKE